MARDHRRLAAIVSADVVGYSLLMGRDDSATLAGLKTHRRELIDPKIVEYCGRIVKTTGDGLLLEFPSVVDAVRCAVDVQRGMVERNTDVPPEQRIEFRIGINVGDIIIDGDDIFGDGVNVAARLQTLAEPGGICVSRVVRDQVLDKLSFAFEDLGSQQVKNIARPVDAYRIDLGGEALQARSHGRWQWLSRAPRWFFWAAGTFMLALVGIGAWTLSPSPSASSPLPLSVAIAPFDLLEGNSDDERSAEQLTHGVVSVLGNDAWYKVIALTSIRKGETPDARAIGREFNVRYLAQGDLRHVGDKLLINTRLIDCETRATAWSDQLEFVAPPATDGTSPELRLARRLRNAIYEREINYANAGASA